jgi:hypothetical protein
VERLFTLSVVSATRAFPPKKSGRGSSQLYWKGCRNLLTWISKTESYQTVTQGPKVLWYRFMVKTGETPVPTDHRSIGELAYQLWQARGCPQGGAEQDWLEAERQLDAATPKHPVVASKAVDDSLKASFPASDPAGSQLPDRPPVNADEKWKAAGVSRKTSTRRSPPPAPPK